MLKLDRVLYTSTRYPANYGFIPRTYADDNDPLDVLVLCQEDIIPMTLVECVPIGILNMIDENENPEDAARRELEEETGIKARTIEYLTSCYTSELHVQEYK